MRCEQVYDYEQRDLANGVAARSHERIEDEATIGSSEKRAQLR